MEENITVTMTMEEAVAVRNAIWHYEDDSGKNDISLACDALEKFCNKENSWLNGK